MRIILMGGMCVGKDTIATYLFEKHGFEGWRLSEIVREIALDFFNVAESDLNAREMYQAIGNAMRSVRPTALCSAIEMRQVEHYGYPLAKVYEHYDILISDVRDAAEQRYFEDRGYVSIKVDAPMQLRKERQLSRDGNANENAFKDISEISAAKLHGQYYIENDGDLKSLHRNLDRIVNHLKSKG